jgi:hypothetical protein
MAITWIMMISGVCNIKLEGEEFKQFKATRQNDDNLNKREYSPTPL